MLPAFFSLKKVTAQMPVSNILPTWKNYFFKFAKL